MLRGILIGLAGLCILGGAALYATGNAPSAVSLVGFGLLLLLGTLFERVRYKRLSTKAPAGSVRTDERFIDDATGKTVTVYVNPTTGERTYVTE